MDQTHHVGVAMNLEERVDYYSTLVDKDESIQKMYAEISGIKSELKSLLDNLQVPSDGQDMLIQCLMNQIDDHCIEVVARVIRTIAEDLTNEQDVYARAYKLACMFRNC